MVPELPSRRGEGVGLVDEVAEGTLQVQGFGGEGAGGFDGAGVLVAQRVKAGGGLVSIVRTCSCSDALHVGHPGVGIEVGHGEKLVAGLFDRVFPAPDVSPINPSAWISAFCFLLSAFFPHMRWVCCWRDVISIRRRTKRGQTVGRRFFSCDRASLWLTRLPGPSRPRTEGAFN